MPQPRPISYHETHEWDPALLHDGRVIYTRDHPFGGHQLQEEIQRRYEMYHQHGTRFTATGLFSPKKVKRIKNPS